MDTLFNFFSHFCGQGRCFAVDDILLPVCQRCLGLYVAAALTGLYLLFSGSWRLGLPCFSVFLIHAAMLLTALAGGIHLIDLGPAWRFMCGLWTGHVIVTWLTGAAAHLRGLTLVDHKTPTPWLLRDKCLILALVAVLTTLPFLLDSLFMLSWYFWITLVIMGLVVLFGTLILSIINLIKWITAVAAGLRPV